MVCVFVCLCVVVFFCRCCVKGSLLEVNERLMKQPQLLNSSVRNNCIMYYCLNIMLFFNVYAMNLYCWESIAMSFSVTSLWKKDRHRIICQNVFLVTYVLLQKEKSDFQADREGYIAIIMPRPADWTKNKESLITLEEYKDKKQDGLLEPCLLWSWWLGLSQIRTLMFNNTHKAVVFYLQENFGSKDLFWSMMFFLKTVSIYN